VVPSEHPEPIKTLSEFRFQALAEKANVPVISAHGMRHSVATALISAGEALSDVAGRLGHSNGRVTMAIYAHALPQNLRKTGNRVAELLAVGS
jgi:integrase